MSRGVRDKKEVPFYINGIPEGTLLRDTGISLKVGMESASVYRTAHPLLCMYLVRFFTKQTCVCNFYALRERPSEGVQPRLQLMHERSNAMAVTAQKNRLY